MPIKTTVIGSFPRQPNFNKNDIKEVINLQLRYGVDIITDGELRGGTIVYFEQIPGLERTHHKLKISEKVRPMDNPDDFYKILDYGTAKSHLSRLGVDKKVKIPLLGPITSGFLCALGGSGCYKNIKDLELYSDLSEALLPIAQRAIDAGAYLQIDEPGLSGGYTSPEFAKKILDPYIKLLPDSAIDEERVSIHVCGSIGRISNLYDTLLSLGVRVISLGFSGKKEKENFDIISRKSLEDNQKRLAAGFISNTHVEGVETPLKRLEKIAEIVGPENIARVSPDCGFGGTDREYIGPILNNLEETRNRFIRSLYV